ncbi:MAG: hypothetical protein OIF40_04520 [Mangrovicoccus sp.]|nr:hypothetical protein [Mangrovicoccus sp.]
MVLLCGFCGGLVSGAFANEIPSEAFIATGGDNAAQISATQGDVALSPSQAAREQWRKLVCSGVIERSDASQAEVSSWGRAPSGTVLPPALADEGFVEGWESRMYPAAVSSSSYDPKAEGRNNGSAAQAGDGGGLIAQGRKALFYGLALMLPAWGAYRFTRRRKPQIASPHAVSGASTGDVQ